MRQSGPQNAPKTPPNTTRQIGQKSPREKEAGGSGAQPPDGVGGGPPRAPQAREAAPIQAARRSSPSSVNGVGLWQYGLLIWLLPYIRS